MSPSLLPARRTLAGLTLLACGLVGGATLAAVGTASAADTGTTSGSSTTSSTATTVDESKSRRSDETLLTGGTAAKVEAAVLAKYAGATVQRLETDSDGVYEAHLVTAAGERVTVEVSKAFVVTGTEARGGPGRHGGPGGGSGETALTGDTLAKVKAAVSARYAGATFDRVETDRDGAYEAHITTGAADRITVEVSKAFAVTGTEEGPSQP
jgi:hypothetical protein